MVIKKVLDKILGRGGDELKPGPNCMIFQIIRTQAAYMYSEYEQTTLVLLHAPEPDLAFPVAVQAMPGDLIVISNEQSLDLQSILQSEGESFEMDTQSNHETVRVVARFFI